MVTKASITASFTTLTLDRVWKRHEERVLYRDNIRTALMVSLFANRWVRSELVTVRSCYLFGEKRKYSQ